MVWSKAAYGVLFLSFIGTFQSSNIIKIDKSNFCLALLCYIAVFLYHIIGLFVSITKRTSMQADVFTFGRNGVWSTSANDRK